MRPLCGPEPASIGTTLSATSGQQPQEPLTHVAIHRVELVRCVAAAEVVAPATKDRIDLPDHFADVPEARPWWSRCDPVRPGTRWKAAARSRRPAGFPQNSCAARLPP